MSRWWRDRLEVTLGPQSLRLARHARLSGRPRGAVERFEVTTDAAGGWEAAVDALAAQLQSPRWRGADLDVRVSGHWVRWLLLPWSEAIATDAERLAWARVEFEGVHGERARGWDLRLAEQRPGRPAPACALDRELVARLRAVAQGAGGRLGRLAPAFADALDAHRRTLAARRSAFAFVEGGRCTLARFDRGQWEHVGSGRHGGRVADFLAAELRRGDAFGAAPAGMQRAYVVFDEAEATLPARLGEWDVVVLGASARAPAPWSRMAARLPGRSA